jgi:hypothetical protein
MTMAKVENDAVTEVGLSPELMGYTVKRLKAMGWYPVEGTEKPTDPVDQFTESGMSHSVHSLTLAGIGLKAKVGLLL